MKYYRNLIEDKLNELAKDGDEADFQIAERWLEGDTRDDFGNLSGTRTFNDLKTRQILFEAGFPFDGDLIDLLEEAGYKLSTLKQGAEAIDVIICELLAPLVAQETLDRIEAEEE
jgi:hypothetical protein